jgi:hypothetical protein
MSYTSKERDSAILLIGQGKEDLTNVVLYEDLERFNWIYLTRLNGKISDVKLTYSGKDLFNRCLNR